MTCEGQQIEDREYGCQMLLSVPEIVFEVVALGFQDIERLVLDPRIKSGDKPSIWRDPRRRVRRRSPG